MSSVGTPSRARALVLLALAVSLLAGCAQRPAMPRLLMGDPARGYRFPSLSIDAPDLQDELFVWQVDVLGTGPGSGRVAFPPDRPAPAADPR